MAPPGNPYLGKPFWLDPNRSSLRATNNEGDGYRKSMLARISSNPTAAWIGDWYPQPQGEANRICTDAQNKNQIPTIVTYAIPIRDLGSYSGGGLGSADAYRNWTDQVASGIGNRPCVVIIEPDALPQADGLNGGQKAERFSLIKYQVDKFATLANCWTYIDCGNSTWRSAGDMANALNQCGIGDARGFATNTSNFNRTPQEVTYGNQISSATGGKFFVIDTSRNGNGPKTDGSIDERVINPEGRALGERPIAPGPSAKVDALLWTKIVGESDGNRAGAPPAGTYYPSYAIGLAERANWNTAPPVQNSSGTVRLSADANLDGAQQYTTATRAQRGAGASTTLSIVGRAESSVVLPTDPIPTFQPRLRLSTGGIVVTGEPAPVIPPVAGGGQVTARTAETSNARRAYPSIRGAVSRTTTATLRIEVSGSLTPPDTLPGANNVIAKTTPATFGLRADLNSATTTRARRATPAVMRLSARYSALQAVVQIGDRWSLWTGREEIPLAMVGWWSGGVLYPLAGSTATASGTDLGVIATAPVIAVGDDGLVAANATLTASQRVLLHTAAIGIRRTTDGARSDSTYGAYDIGRLTSLQLLPTSEITLTGGRYLGEGTYEALVVYTLTSPVLDADGLVVEPALEYEVQARTAFQVVYDFDRPLYRTLRRRTTASLRVEGRPGAAVIIPDRTAFLGRSASAALTVTGTATFTDPGTGTTPAQPTTQQRLRLRADGIVVQSDRP